MPRYQPKPLPTIQVLMPEDLSGLITDEIDQPQNQNPEGAGLGVKATADVPAPEYSEIPKDLYDEAWVEHSHRGFNDRIMAARTPVIKAVIAPAVAPQILATTQMEMEAGRKRVADFAEAEMQRRAIPRKKEAWEGSNTPIFRPGQFDEYKGTLKSPAHTVDKTHLVR